jgi:hypothetical protein
MGAAVLWAAGWTLAAETLPGSTVAVVLLSSVVGLGAATEGCPCVGCALLFCVVTGFDASVTGSVSPLAASQAFQPPSRARAL